MSLEVLVRENEGLREQITVRDERLAKHESRIADLESQLEQLAEKLHLTAKERRLLEQQLARLQGLRRRHPFLDPGQGAFDFGDGTPGAELEERPEHVGEAPDGETPDDSIRQRHKPKQPARKIDTSSLPVEHRYHELPPEERVCQVTGKPLVAVGEKLEEEIQFEPGYVKRIVHHCVVYGISEEDARERQGPEVMAPGPVRPLEGSIAGALLLAWILVQKYVRHLPLYRQETILAQHGLRIPRQTTCDWVMRAAYQLGPIQAALRREIIASGVVQVDDTPVKCQLGKGRGNILAHLWTTVSPLAEGVVYDFSESREHEHLFEILSGFRNGVLLGDGYAGYDAFANTRPGVVVAGCWAHALRKFRDALSEAPILAVSAMTHIGKLFDLEKKVTDEELSLEERLALRRRESAKVIEALEKEVRGWRELYSESGQMGTACKYLENQREHLRVFLDDPRVPIHNNACEVSIRPVAIGRRNWLFAGSPRGGRAAATIYTLVESCKLVGVDPELYLADVLTRVATHPASRVHELIPANWRSLYAPAAIAS
jgi:transposase